MRSLFAGFVALVRCQLASLHEAHDVCMRCRGVCNPGAFICASCRELPFAVARSTR